MDDIGKRIKSARELQKLTIEQLSEKTKIRAYVIEAIESGDYSIMPDVYIKSFIKTLTNFLKIDYADAPIINKSEPNKKQKFDDEGINTPTQKAKNKESKSFTKTFADKKANLSKSKNQTGATNDFAELFKKRKIDVDTKYLYINRAIYAVLIIAVVVAIYFAFTSLTGSSSKIDSIELLKKNDTISLENEGSSLFSYFEKPDSMRLTAKAHDTVWIRVNADGKTISESLLKPGMVDSWLAKEYFLVDLGNVGGAEIYRNDELLPQFGRRGSVVKNIKITPNEVLNVYTPKDDSARISERRIRKKKEEEKKQPRIIEESTIYTTQPTQLVKPDSIKLR